MKKIVIAIDGYSACGKSSTAKQVAERLGYTFIDSGAMYRAVTLFFLRNNVDLSSQKDVDKALGELNISFQGRFTLLNGEDVSDAIREKNINENVSAVSAISAVRKKMVEQQRKIGINKEIVMDGRDIGTVVFPDAELKIFMTAEMEVRAKRRQKELEEKGIKYDLSDIIQNLENRDRVDSTREDSPLMKAENAIELDTTKLTLEDQISQIVQMANKLIHEN